MSKSTKRKTAPARRRVTALARRPKVDVLPAAPAEPLSERTIVGMLGKIELKLTVREEAVLSEAVTVDDVRVKPSGQPYLSHPTYTKWFNRAFGRLGWMLVPAAAPMKNEEGVVVVPYLLHIHGKPAAFAFGEQEWFEGNREQTYGDALEATVASGLRRCAKRMGVGLELWDRPWLNRYLDEHCVEVLVVKKGRKDGKEYQARQWRRKIDPPFWNEITKQKGSTVKTADGGRRTIDDDVPVEPAQTRAVEKPRDAHHAGELQPITDKQLQRLWVIIRNSGRIENVVKTWLLAKYKVEHTKDIARRDYDAICTAIESPKSLPL